MDTQDLIAKVRRLEIRSKDLTRNLFAGDYHSAFKGRGMSFADVRTYQYGDDIRSIDWNVTARTDEPHIKQFEEERELTVMLMVDISGSSFTGGDHQSKRDFITEIAAVLAFAASSNNDKVGMLLFADEVYGYFPPKKGSSYVLRLIRELVSLEPTRRSTDIGKALGYLNNVVKKRAITFLISDFISEPYETALAISSKRHDLIGLFVHSKFESHPELGGVVRVRGAERDASYTIDLSNRAHVWRWKERFSSHLDETKTSFRKSGSDIIEIPAGEPYIGTLHRFFKQRALRR